MIRNVWVAVIFAWPVVWGFADIGEVRAALDQYTNSVRRTAVRVETIRNVGVPNVEGAAYCVLCQTVSNDVATVFHGMPQITTNAAERLLLMSTAWQYDENFYLRAYTVLADMALSNQVSSAELEWFSLPKRNDLANCIRCRYRESQVTNLAYKISQVTGDLNTYHEIVTGVSYTNYLEEVAAGLWQ